MTMPLKGWKPRMRRPTGQFRIPRLQLGERLQLRILSDCTPGGPTQGIPAYEVHYIAPMGERKRGDRVPCLEVHYPGMCSRVRLPDGESLHSKNRGITGVVAVWCFDRHELMIFDLNDRMCKQILQHMATPQLGDPRGYNYLLSAVEGSNAQFPVERQLTPLSVPNPQLPAELQQIITRQWAEVTAHLWPQVSPEDVAEYLGGEIVPEAAYPTTSAPPTSLFPPVGEQVPATLAPPTTLPTTFAPPVDVPNTATPPLAQPVVSAPPVATPQVVPTMEAPGAAPTNPLPTPPIPPVPGQAAVPQPTGAPIPPPPPAAIWGDQ